MTGLQILNYINESFIFFDSILAAIALTDVFSLMIIVISGLL